MHEEGSEEDAEHVERPTNGKIIFTEWKIFDNFQVPPDPPDSVAKCGENYVDIS